MFVFAYGLYLLYKGEEIPYFLAAPLLIEIAVEMFFVFFFLR